MPPKEKETKQAAEVVEQDVPVGKGTEKQRRTLAVIDAQPKITVLFPRMDGQPPEMVVTINAVRWVIPAGVPTEVPQSVAEIFNERLASEGRMIRRSEQDVQKMTAEGLI